MSKLKAVLIVGEGLTILDETRQLYTETEGFLLIEPLEAGYLFNPEELIEKLAGRVDSGTRIDINAHGSVHGGRKDHALKLLANDEGDISFTKNTFKLLREIYPGPIQIHLWSCYGGAAFREKDVLPKGSVLICNAPSYASVNSQLADIVQLRSIAYYKQQITSDYEGNFLHLEQVLYNISAFHPADMTVSISGVISPDFIFTARKAAHERSSHMIVAQGLNKLFHYGPFSECIVPLTEHHSITLRIEEDDMQMVQWCHIAEMVLSPFNNSQCILTQELPVDFFHKTYHGLSPILWKTIHTKQAVNWQSLCKMVPSTYEPLPLDVQYIYSKIFDRQSNIQKIVFLFGSNEKFLSSVRAKVMEELHADLYPGLSSVHAVLIMRWKELNDLGVITAEIVDELRLVLQNSSESDRENIAERIVEDYPSHYVDTIREVLVHNSLEDVMSSAFIAYGVKQSMSCVSYGSMRKSFKCVGYSKISEVMDTENGKTELIKLALDPLSLQSMDERQEACLMHKLERYDLFDQWLRELCSNYDLCLQLPIFANLLRFSKLTNDELIAQCLHNISSLEENKVETLFVLRQYCKEIEQGVQDVLDIYPELVELLSEIEIFAEGYNSILLFFAPDDARLAAGCHAGAGVAVAGAPTILDESGDAQGGISNLEEVDEIPSAGSHAGVGVVVAGAPAILDNSGDAHGSISNLEEVDVHAMGSVADSGLHGCLPACAIL